MINSLFKVFSGNIFVQLIGLLSVPILTHVYNPEELSYLGTFTSCIAIFSVLVSLRAENNLFVIHSDDECSKYVIFLYALSLLITPCIFLFFYSVFSLFSIKQDGEIFYISILGGFTYAIFNIKYNYLVRCGLVNKYVVLRMLRMVLELLSVILAYFLNLNIYMLIILIGVSYLIPLLTNKTFFSKIADREIVSDLQIGKFVFVKNISNIKFDFPASIFSMISIYLPIVYFFISGDKAFSGVYFAINRFIGAPSLLIAQSFGTTLKQYAAEEYRSFNHCTKSTIKGLKIVFIYMLPIYLLGGVAFFILFKYLLSQEWKGIISTGWMLFPLFVLRYFFNCFANIVYVKGLFKENMLFQIISAIVAFLALLLPNALSEKVIYFSVSMSIYYLIYLLYLLKVSLTK